MIIILAKRYITIFVLLHDVALIVPRFFPACRMRK